MSNNNVRYTPVYGKAKLMLFSTLLLASLFSCKKEINEPELLEADLNPAQSLVAGNPNLIYEETFEGSTYFPLSGTSLNKTHGIENCNDGSTTTPATYDWTLGRRSSPAFQQSNAARFEIRKVQPLVGSAQRFRSEVTVIKGTEDSRFTREIWYSFAMLIPTIGGENDRRVAINQWFEDGSQETTLRTDNGKCYLETGSTVPVKRYDLFSASMTTDETSASFKTHPRDEWHEFAFHFIHSMGSDGLIEIYRDGAKIHTIHGPNMHLQLPKWKIGLYASMEKAATDFRAIYFDNIRVGKASATIEDMTSSITPIPTPVPPTPAPVNVAPTTSITSPAVNASFQAPATITINASAADNDGTVSRVDFYNGTTLIGTDNSSPYSYTWSNVAAGNYSITSKATDNSGASTVSTPVAVSVTAPAPPTSSLAINSFTLVNAGTEKDIMTITNGATISLKQIGTGKLNIRANPNSTVEKVNFALSGKQSKTFTDKVAPYALMGDDERGNYYFGNWNPPALGTYTLKATPVLGTDKGVTNTITFTFVQ